MKNKNGDGDGRRKYQIIGKVKEQTEVSELCQNHPWEFGVYLRYCRNLRFAQKPDYNYLRLVFRGCLKRLYDTSWSSYLNLLAATQLEIGKGKIIKKQKNFKKLTTLTYNVV